MNKKVKYSRIKKFADKYNPLLERIKEHMQNDGIVAADNFTQEELDFFDNAEYELAYAIIEDLGKTLAYRVSEDIIDYLAQI